MGQDRFLDLARIDVGAARDEHVRRPAGDVEEAPVVQVAQVAGVEPAVLERLRVRLVVLEIAEEDGGAAHADFTRLMGRQALAVVRQDGDVHAGARQAARADRIGRIVLDRVQARRQDGDVAGDLAETEILNQDLADLAQGVLLVGPVHGRAGVDDIAQRGMVVAVHRLMLGQHGQDGRHGEHVRHLVFLDQAPGLFAIQSFAGQQHAGGALGDLGDGMDARAVRQGGDHQGDVVLRRVRHQVAQVIDGDEGHLAVGQHPRLGATRGARGVEEPANVVAVYVGQFDVRGRGVGDQGLPILARRVGADPEDVLAGRVGLFRCRGVIGKAGVEDMGRGARRGGQISDLRRRQTEVRRHPHRAQTPAGPLGLEHGVAVARMDQDAVALFDAARG